MNGRHVILGIWHDLLSKVLLKLIGLLITVKLDESEN